MKDMKTLDTCDSRSKERVYKKLGLILLDNLLTAGKAEALIKKTIKNSEQYYAYIFDGEEPLMNLEVIEDIIAKVPGKHELVTPGSKKYWWKEHKESWRALDKVTVLRNSSNDEYNNSSLGIETISNEDYNEMPAELKEKIIFLVEPKQSDMRSAEDVLKFIEWAHNMGIKKVVFKDNKRSNEWKDYQEARKEVLRKEYSAKNKQFEAVRTHSYDSEKANQKQVVRVKKPLLLEVFEELLKKGFNFKAQKAENSKNGFFDIRELKQGEKEVAFKFQIKHAELIATIIYRDIHIVE